MRHPYFSPVRRPSLWAGAGLLAMGLAGCGGGSDGTAAGPAAGAAPSAPVVTTLSGTAATGAPIQGGAVQVLCRGASAPLLATTSSTGTWEVDTTGQTLPCAVRVQGGNLPAGQAYHSVALRFGNTNVTPLTDLMVAHLAGQSPAVWWGNSGPVDWSVATANALEQSLQSLRKALGLDALHGIDPVADVFKAQRQDAMDDVLEALRLALERLGMSYQTLLASAATVDFSMPDSFRVTLRETHHSVTVSPGGVVVDGPSGGSHTLTLNVTASGFAMPPVVVRNVPMPTSQEEFCGWVNDPANPQGLSQTMQGASGRVDIRSCSFSGSVGRISAVVVVTSPISTSMPYDVVYTYQ